MDNELNNTGYDIIGDIHGHADELLKLLEKMDYRFTDGCYRHEDRIAVFLGDFIDRGPKQRKVLNTVMPMVREGAALAVMGNHEFNALAFHTQHPDIPGKWLRPRNNKNTHQHIAFLDEYKFSSRKSELKVVLDFFYSLPLWLDLGDLRVIHACWDEASMDEIKGILNSDNTINEEVLVAATTEGDITYEAIEKLLKGQEYSLPDNHYFEDKDGHKRTEVRTKWWHTQEGLLGDLTMPPNILDATTSNISVNAHELTGYHEHEPPLFIGHYWMNDNPQQLANNIACLDYSVAKGGKLVAYRWCREQDLKDQNFCFET